MAVLQIDAQTGQDQGALRGAPERMRPFKVRQIRHRGQGHGERRPGGGGIGRTGGQVAAELQMHGSGSAADGSAQQVAHDPARVLARAQGVAGPGKRTGQRQLIKPLMRVAPRQAGRHLGRQQEERRAVQPGVTQAGQGVGEPWPQSRQADAGPPFQARGGGRHVERGAFVVHQHEVHAAAAQGFQQLDVLAARQAADACDAGLTQGPRYRLRHVHVNIARSSSSACAAARSSGVPRGNQKSAPTMETARCCA